MRLHSSVFGQADADSGEVDETVEIEVEALVGETGIADSRTNTLKTLRVEVGNGQLFIGRIPPIELTNRLVSTLYSGFSQAVSKGLTEQPLVVVRVFIQMLYGFISTGRKDTDTVANAFGIDGANEIGQAKEGLRLLTQEREKG